MRVTDEMVRRLSDHLKQKVFYGTLNNEARDTKAREFLEVALSHAAGQEGEQCRAASGDREALATRLRELICEYWDLAYDEGVDKRNSDTPAGDANRVANEIETIIRALSRGVPEGRVVVDLGETGCLHGATVEGDVTVRASHGWQVHGCIFRGAIAAQRKEGG